MWQGKNVKYPEAAKAQSQETTKPGDPKLGSPEGTKAKKPQSHNAAKPQSHKATKSQTPVEVMKPPSREATSYLYRIFRGEL